MANALALYAPAELLLLLVNLAIFWLVYNWRCFCPCSTWTLRAWIITASSAAPGASWPQVPTQCNLNRPKNQQQLGALRLTAHCFGCPLFWDSPGPSPKGNLVLQVSLVLGLPWPLPLRQPSASGFPCSENPPLAPPQRAEAPNIWSDR